MHVAGKHPRRLFLGSTAAFSLGAADLAIGSGTLVPGLLSVTDEQLSPIPQFVQFRPEIEPLVRLLEETPQERLVEEIGRRVRDGLNYQQLLSALFLAGIRNIQPRPSVGFKFHAVLVVNSAHLASLASPPQDRWLPIFWAIHEFKRSQTRDATEGDWTMPAVKEDSVPLGSKAMDAFELAMRRWDESAADVAAAGVARSLGANQVLDLMAKFVARDFRSIGHKAIYLANSWRTLQTIGWQHAEPVLRSVVYAALNHVGEPNPAESDLAPDRSWRRNQELAKSIRHDWTDGKQDSRATMDLIRTLRNSSPEDAARSVVEQLNGGISSISILDALHLSAAELLMRQNGIVALHAATTTNAMRFLFDHTADPLTRQQLLLQAAAFLPQFREAMRDRGEVASVEIDQVWSSPPQAEKQAKLSASSNEQLSHILALLRKDSPAAAQQTMEWLDLGHDAQQYLDSTRRLVFLKGDDSHDYKFSSAVLEDFRLVSPEWRNRFLAASSFSFRGSQETDNGLIERIRNAIG